jgi:hypothetical protein
MSLLFAAIGCGSSATDTGAPHLVSLLAQVPGAADVDYLAPPDGGAPAVSGVAQFKLVFDKLLDGDKIETVTTTTQPKTDVISITWMNAPAGAPAITANTLYDPSGALSVTTPGPKIMLAPAPGLPSGAQLLFKLDRSKITGKTGTPFDGPDTQTVATLPFDVATDLMPGVPLAPDGTLHLAFTNSPGMNVADHIKITAGGAPVVVDVSLDPADPRNRLVTSMAWLPGQTLVLTIDKGAGDLFGVTLAQDVTATFAIAAGDGGVAPGDAGSGADGGPVDAGAGPDAGSVDAAPDAAAGADGASPDAASDGPDDAAAGG